MIVQALIISVTLTLSLIASQISQAFSEFLAKGHWLKIGDHIARGILLGYAISILLPESLETFGLIYFLCLCFGFSLSIFVLEYGFQKACAHTILDHKPWFFYACLLPHCILEGFTITSLQKAGSLFFLTMFLIHKTSEITVVTLSSQIHLKQVWQQRCVQWIFVLATPMAMITLLVMQSSTDLSQWHTWHAFVDLLSLVALVHLALFCKLCHCTHAHDAKNSNQNLVLATSFLVSLIIFYLMNHLMPSHEHIHHDAIHEAIHHH